MANAKFREYGVLDRRECSSCEYQGGEYPCDACCSGSEYAPKGYSSVTGHVVNVTDLVDDEDFVEEEG